MTEEKTAESQEKGSPPPESQEGLPELALSNQERITTVGNEEDEIFNLTPTAGGFVIWETAFNRKNIRFKRANNEREELFFLTSRNSSASNDNTVSWTKWFSGKGCEVNDSNVLIRDGQEHLLDEILIYFPGIEVKQHLGSDPYKWFSKDSLSKSIHREPFSTKIQFLMGGKFILRINPKHKFFAGFDMDVPDFDKKQIKKINSHDLLEECDPLVLRFKDALGKTEENFVSGDILLNGDVYIVSELGFSIFNVSPGKPQEVDQSPVFFEGVRGDPDFRVFQDPNQESKVFFCNSRTVDVVKSIDIDASGTKSAVEHKLPMRFSHIEKILFDPSGEFLLIESDSKTTVIHWKTGRIVSSLDGLKKPSFGPDGKLYYEEKDDSDKSVIFSADINLEEIAGQYKKLWLESLRKAIASGVKGEEARELALLSLDDDLFQDLEPDRKIINEENLPNIKSLATLQDLENYRISLAAQQRLLAGQYDSSQVSFLMREVEAAFSDKEKEVVESSFEGLVQDLQDKVIGQSDVSYELLVSFSRDLEEVHSRRGFLSQDQRMVLGEVRQQLKDVIDAYFVEKRADFEIILQSKFDLAIRDIESFKSLDMLIDWKAFDLPLIREHFYAVMRDIPQDQTDLIDLVQEYLQKIRIELKSAEDTLSTEVFEAKGKQESGRQVLADQARLDIDDFFEGLLKQNFSDVYDLQRQLIDNSVLEALRNQVEALATNWPELKQELFEYLDQGISRLTNQVMRMQQTETRNGEQYIMFGDVSFPLFQKEKIQQDPVELELSFIAGDTGQKDVIGDVGFSIRKPDGDIDQILLFESKLDRDNWKYGIYSYMGESIPPTMMSVEEFRVLYGNYIDWSQGEDSTIQKELGERREALRVLYAQREKVGDRSEEEKWEGKGEYEELLKEYAQFVKEKQVFLLRQIEKGDKAIQSGEEKNGNGHVPEWKSHWVVDEQSQDYLERMAENLKMQLDLNTGMLLLVGHTGTGKDVLLNMFCERTQRPKFDFDCSKWTTEFELSEDVVLQDGGVVPVPSKVLKAIQTPGSVLYFNEFNAMPESAQIFLHALLDEKRSLTLKTRSGKVIKAAEGVLIAGSMNANYPGTFKPQFATRGRMVTQRIQYPPLKREKDIGGGNMAEVFDGSEAMRIAREVTSLKTLTEGVVAVDTAFMKFWDGEINRMDKKLGFDPTQEQTFDLEVIVAITQFAAQLREHFVSTIEKTRGRSDLKVEQPVSGRDLRNCAYALREIPLQQKTDGSLIPERVARDLLERFFVEHIDDEEQRKDIVAAMKNWPVTKRTV